MLQTSRLPANCPLHPISVRISTIVVVLIISIVVAAVTDADGADSAAATAYGMLGDLICPCSR